MAVVYAEFGIEIFDNNIVSDCIRVLNILGKVVKIETKRNTIIVDYCTSTQNIEDLEILSDSLCDVIEPNLEEINTLLVRNSDKLYAGICFIKINDEKNDIALKINRRLIRLTNALNIEIEFDGF